MNKKEMKKSELKRVTGGDVQNCLDGASFGIPGVCIPPGMENASEVFFDPNHTGGGPFQAVANWISLGLAPKGLGN